MYIHGKAHPTLQHYECATRDLKSLLKALPDAENPFSNWKSRTEPESTATIEFSNLSSWIPNNDQKVFHSLEEMSDDSASCSHSSSSSLRESFKMHFSKRSISPVRSSLTYHDLHECIKSCPDYQSSATIVVALLLPPCMMTEMATVMLSLLAKDNVCVAPLDYNMPMAKLRDAFRQLQCRGLVTDKAMASKITSAHFRDLRIVTQRPDKVGAVEWNVMFQEPFVGGDVFVLDDNDGETSDRPAMLLRTSGTTSVPKVVPLTGAALLYNATCIASSLQLKSDDVGCNAMPLFHIGGISCALLSVLISGSSTIMMGAFGPETFLDTLQSDGSSSAKPTWFYAVPSMHKALLLTAKARLLERSENIFTNRLRFIRSGAAHLPHETAIELSKVFRTKVIPTYSMTESMPVCSSHHAPLVWNEDNSKVVPNSVGLPIGCSLRIVNELGNTLPYGVSGEVALSGPGVMQGYLGVESTDSHTEDGWLRTGDVGQMDERGNLKLCGRSKEMIKRGGDQVWPIEVDRLVEAVPAVNTAVTFGVPNEMWGEEVAVAVVLDQSPPGVDSKTIEEFILEICGENLNSASIPSQIVFVDSTDDLPKGPTGKYLRSGLASSLSVQSVDNGTLNVLKNRARVEDKAQKSKPIMRWTRSSLNRIRPTESPRGGGMSTREKRVRPVRGKLGWLRLRSIRSRTLISRSD